jgi:hypothetical protein
MKKLHYLVAAITALSAQVAMAQATVGTAAPAGTATKVAAPTQPAGNSTSSEARQKTAENTPQCVHIINECKQLGFIPGQYKVDNGLWKDCFDPVLSGKGNATRDGKPVTVPVNQSDVKACHKALAASKA